jgi:predicted component of type VI protein secretion system
MKSVKANAAALRQPEQFKSRELTDSTEIGGTLLGHVFISLQQLANEIEPDAVIRQLSGDLPDFLDQRTTLIDLARFLQSKARSEQTRQLSESLADRLQNLKALGQ